MPLMRSNRGFTVVELLTATGIVGLLLAIAVPSLSTLRQESNLASAQREIMAALYIGRSGAITTNAPRSVVITPPRRIQIKDSGGTVLSTQDLHRYGTDVTFSGTDGSGNAINPVTITYDARGLLNPASTVTVTITNPKNQTKTVKVYPTGKAEAS